MDRPKGETVKLLGLSLGLPKPILRIMPTAFMAMTDPESLTPGDVQKLRGAFFEVLTLVGPEEVSRAVAAAVGGRDVGDRELLRQILVDSLAAIDAVP